MTRFLHSRFFVVVAALIAIACMIGFFFVGSAPYPVTFEGLVPAWDMEKYGLGYAGLVAGLGVNIIIASLLCYLNKGFNLLRCMTMLQGSMFLIMETATPSDMMYLAPGIVICLVVVLCMVLMYANYSNSANQRSVFLIFFLLSLGGSLDYGFLLYAPAFWVIMGQMRIFSFRSFLASMLGLLTPWVILLGLGIVPWGAVEMPQVVGWEFPASNTVLWIVFATALFTIFLGIIAWAQNVIKVLTYNAQSRAMLGVVAVLFAFTLVGMFANPMHVGAFLPMLNCCAALQIAHMFGVLFRKPHSCWVILIILLIYLGIFSWRTVLCAL